MDEFSLYKQLKIDSFKVTQENKNDILGLDYKKYSLKEKFYGISMIYTTP